MGENSGITVQVTDGGSGTGVAALSNGTADITESARPIRDTEKNNVKDRWGKEVVELPVIVGGLAVYVHESNPLTELTLEQVKVIFSGAVKNWKDVGGGDERIILSEDVNYIVGGRDVRHHSLERP